MNFETNLSINFPNLDYKFRIMIETTFIFSFVFREKVNTFHIFILSIFSRLLNVKLPPTPTPTPPFPYKRIFGVRKFLFMWSGWRGWWWGFLKRRINIWPVPPPPHPQTLTTNHPYKRGISYNYHYKRVTSNNHHHNRVIFYQNAVKILKNRMKILARF